MLHDDDSSHFKSKLINVGNSRFNNAVHGKSRYKPSVPTLHKDQVVHIHEQIFVVESETNEEQCYSVDIR